jgi:teichuronic acid biosynthesis glycosyltransferase TuaC
MFRLGERLPIVVISPQAWSPFDWLIRRFRKSFRLQPPFYEQMGGVDIYRPRYLSVPGIFKSWDGWLMARGSKKSFENAINDFKPTVIDAHFLFPDGNAAHRLAEKFAKPLVVSVRGSKDRRLVDEPAIATQMSRVLRGAARVVCVSTALREEVALKLGARKDRCHVVGNGVDLGKFCPIDKLDARRNLGIAADAKVLIGVGNLIELKGFHRIIPLLGRLREEYPSLVYLIVGGPASQGDVTPELKALIAKHRLEEVVRLCGRLTVDRLLVHYSASDVFTLATSYEGWANVFLEAMACGLPVVTTKVGGNSEVVVSEEYGTLVEFFDAKKFCLALQEALSKDWDRVAIINYAHANSWEDRIDVLEKLYKDVVAEQVQ